MICRMACSLLPVVCARRATWYSAAAGCCLLGQLLRTDYGAFGVLLCLLFYCTRGLPGRFWICGGIFLLMCYAFQFVFLPGIPIPLEALALPAFPLLATYHGRRSHRQLPIRYAFYWFYPLHMLLLGLLAHTTP